MLLYNGLGLLAGVYIAQNYNLPNLSGLAESLTVWFKALELAMRK